MISGDLGLNAYYYFLEPFISRRYLMKAVQLLNRAQ